MSKPVQRLEDNCTPARVHDSPQLANNRIAMRVAKSDSMEVAKTRYAKDPDCTRSFQAESNSASHQSFEFT